MKWFLFVRDMDIKIMREGNKEWVKEIKRERLKDKLICVYTCIYVFR